MNDVIKKISKSKIILIPIIIIVVILVSGSHYVIHIDDGTYNENNNSNVPYAKKTVVDEALKDEISSEGLKTTNSSDGGYKLDIDLEKVADDILKQTSITNGGNIENYLKNSATRSDLLKKMIKAEIITQYPDLRKRDKIGSVIPINDIQGIIKFERHKEDGSSILLEYIPLGELNGRVNNANQNNIVNLDADILNYFSINENGELIIAYYEGIIDLELSLSREIGNETNVADSYNEMAGDTMESATYKDYSKIDDYYVKDDQNSYAETKDSTQMKYTYKTKAVNYKNMVSKYTMPFEYLWAFTVIRRRR